MSAVRYIETLPGGYEHSIFKMVPRAVYDEMAEVVVPPGHLFVMGDNRDGSFDSRFWGPLPDRLLKGKALFVYWPFNRVKGIH